MDLANEITAQEYSSREDMSLQMLIGFVAVYC